MLVLLPLAASFLLLTISDPARAGVSPNLAEFNRTCGKQENLVINKICSGVPNSTLKLFGEDFGVHYVRSKTKSRVFVGLILTKCAAGEYCVHLAQSEPSELEDRLLLSWRDQRIRDSLCALRPCLSRLPDCGNPEHRLIFRAIDLLCGLTAMQTGGSWDLGGGGVPYCLEGGLDLLQYAFADLNRPVNDSLPATCDCLARASNACPRACRQFIYKLNCLYSQCLPHERKQIASFPSWQWYFGKSAELKKKYNVTFCERPIETAAAAAGNRGPVILAFFPNVGNVVMIVVLIVVLVALLMVGVTCACWQRIFLTRYSRDRVGYTEVKGSL